jgi:DNA repair exonuclease SbcCD ATPase subunit
MNAKTPNKTNPPAEENAELKAALDAKVTLEAEVKEAKATQTDAEKATKEAIAEKVAAEEKANELEAKLTAANAEAEQLKEALKKAPVADAKAEAQISVNEENVERRLFTLISNVRMGGKTYPVGTSMPLTQAQHADLLSSNAVAAHWHEAERA